MVLRCPQCLELKFFGRTQVLGELVVCPGCEAVFRWREAETDPSEADGSPRDARRAERKRRKR